MKKFLFLLAILPMMWACSSGDSPDEGSGKNVEITGVWESGDVLVSFDGEGYYAAILDDTFLDCGSYTFNGETISCSNTYLNKNTIYQVDSEKGGVLSLTATYKNFKGKDEVANLRLTKTNKKPASKDHVLIGKEYRFMLDEYGHCYVEFNSHNTAKMQTDELRPKIQNWNYFYIEPYIYSQKYKPETQGLSLFFKNCDKGVIFKQEVKIGNNGEIEKMEIKN